MASICVHRAPPTPSDSTPGHIRSRDDFQEFGRPATHGPQSLVRARALAFLQFTWHGNRHSTGFQGTLARAMASICVHRAPRTPSDIAPRHIGSRDDFQEFGRPATHGPQSPVSARALAFLQFTWHPNRPSRALQGTLARAMASICVHRAPRTPSDIAPRHIGSRDGLQEEPRPDTELPRTALRAWLEHGPSLSCNSPGTAIAILRASRAH